MRLRCFGSYFVTVSIICACSQAAPNRRTQAIDVGIDNRVVDAGNSQDAATEVGLRDVGVEVGPICSNATCTDNVACNGIEYCDIFVGCTPGNPVMCDDSVACTIDSCSEPAGTCSHRAPDQDGDGATLLGCLGGLDCNDQSAQINPAAVEICDGIDNNCDGNVDPGCNSTSTYYRDMDGDTFGNLQMALTATTMPAGYVLSSTDCNDNNANVRPNASETCDGIDNNCDAMADNGTGMNCVSGSAPMSCMTSCTTPGTRVCTACMLGECRAAQETCQNNCDDNGDGQVDEGCPPPGGPPPANDLPSAPTVLSGSLGSMTLTLAGATQQGSGCGGAEIYVQATLGQASMFYLDTFDIARDTLIAYRGTSCNNAPVECVNDSCGGVGAQVLRSLAVGTHCFSIALGASASPGDVRIRWQTIRAASGTNTVVPSSMVVTGTLASSPSHHQPTCASGLPSTSENGYSFALCPSVSTQITATTCSTMTVASTVLTVITGGTTFACNNGDANCMTPVRGSRVSLGLDGPGFVTLIVDGIYPQSGAYSLAITRTDT